MFLVYNLYHPDYKAYEQRMPLCKHSSYLPERNLNSSNKFEVLEAEIKNSNYTIVKSKIVENSDQPEIKIDWRIYTKNPEKPLIRDLIVEGLSLARTQKEEFSSILNSNNGDINSLFSTLSEFSKN